MIIIYSSGWQTIWIETKYVPDVSVYYVDSGFSPWKMAMNTWLPHILVNNLPLIAPYASIIWQKTGNFLYLGVWGLVELDLEY